MKFLLSIHYIVWLVISALFFAAGEFLSKKFALNPKASLVVLMLVIYSMGTLAWLPAIMQRNQLSIVGVMWSVLTVVATILIGVMIFNEKLGTVSIIGIIFGMISVALLSIG